MEQSLSTKEKLLESAKKEFLLRGYQKASLRSICKNAEVTTGALYFFFKNKEVLFDNIVCRVVKQLEQMIKIAAEREQLELESSYQNEREIMTYLYQNKEEVIILLQKSEGTAYAGFKQQLEKCIEQYFQMFFKQYLGYEIPQSIIELMVSVRIEAYIKILMGNYSLEETLRLVDIVALYADAGFKAFIEQEKQNKK